MAKITLLAWIDENVGFAFLLLGLLELLNFF